MGEKLSKLARGDAAGDIDVIGTYARTHAHASA